MGYCYDMRGRLACDSCGTCGGVRKRTCPFRVHYAEGGSLPYCQPAALCKTCYATHKPSLHAGCKAGAAARTADEVVKATKLAAGEFLVRTCWGDWHPDVPEGLVGVRFEGAAGAVTFRLLPKDGYTGGGHWLSEFPEALFWRGPADGASTKGNLVMGSA